MIYLKKCLLVFFLFFSFYIHAQNSTELNNRLISALVKYRHELIAGDDAKIKSLAYLNYLWEESDSIYREKVVSMLFNIIHARNFYQYDSAQIAKKIEKQYPYLKELGGRVIRDIDLIIDNQQLIDLLAADVLVPHPPYQIAAKTDIFEEMAFYKIKASMKIGEIGAGTGTWSFITTITFDSLDMYINEIDAAKVDFIKQKFTDSRLPGTRNRIHYLLGNEQSTAMEGANLDKIIIRNSFHHFSKPRRMLDSIKKSLAPDGSLYIFDPVVFPDKRKSGCPEKITAEKLKNLIQSGGFEIVELKFSTNWKWILVHCKPG